MRKMTVRLVGCHGMMGSCFVDLACASNRGARAKFNNKILERGRKNQYYLVKSQGMSGITVPPPPPLNDVVPEMRGRVVVAKF